MATKCFDDFKTAALSKVRRFQGAAFVAVLYVASSALCSVLQIRIYKQLLVYSYVHEIVITTAIQTSIILPLAALWCVYVKCSELWSGRYGGERGSERAPGSGGDDRIDFVNIVVAETYGVSDTSSSSSASSYEDEGNENSSFETSGYGDSNVTLDYVDTDYAVFNVASSSAVPDDRATEDPTDDGTKSSSRPSTITSTRKDYGLPDAFTKSSFRFYASVSLLQLISGGMYVLPVMMLPSILMVLMDQFGLFPMVAVAIWYSGRTYNRTQAVCICLVAAGLLVSIIPDYVDSYKYFAVGTDANASYYDLESREHDAFWKSMPFSGRYGREDEFARSDGTGDSDASLLGTLKYANSSDFDLSRCFSFFYKGVPFYPGNNVSDLRYSSFVESFSLSWWKNSYAAFAFCIVLAAFSSVPECFSYAIMEKYWGLSTRTHRDKSGEEGGRWLGPLAKTASTGMAKSVYIAAGLLFFRMAWVMMILPLFFLSNDKLGGRNYLAQGAACSMETLRYEAWGDASMDFNVSRFNGTDPRVLFYKMPGDPSKALTSETLVGGLGGGGDWWLRNAGEGSVLKIHSGLWECSAWRNGLDCAGMLSLTMVYCLADFIRTALRVKLLRDTSHAILVWLLEIARIGVSDIMFSAPLVSGPVYSDVRYFDVLSLAIVAMSTGLFWMHREETFDGEVVTAYGRRKGKGPGERYSKKLKGGQVRVERLVKGENDVSDGPSVDEDGRRFGSARKRKRNNKSNAVILGVDSDSL
jgi:hypothetical protein